MDTDQTYRHLAVSRIVIACQNCHETLDTNPTDLKNIHHVCPSQTNGWKPTWLHKEEEWIVTR